MIKRKYLDHKLNLWEGYAFFSKCVNCNILVYFDRKYYLAWYENNVLMWSEDEYALTCDEQVIKNIIE